MQTEVVVVTSAYGYDNVKKMGGQGVLLPLIAASGADGIEIRRELFDDGSSLSLQTLETLAQQIAHHRLFAIYSIPEGLFTVDGRLNPFLTERLEEAQRLRARKIKFSLGHYRHDNDFALLGSLLKDFAGQLVVENDQTVDCGILPPLLAFFQAAEHNQLPIGMTFDMANWCWVGEDAELAAEQFSPYVSYIHVKMARSDEKGWRAISLDDSDGRWQTLLNTLPQNAMRGIEFPLEGDDLLAVTRHYVDVLRKKINE